MSTTCIAPPAPTSAPTPTPTPSLHLRSATDEQLLAAHLDGHPRAFTELIDRHRGALCWAITRMGIHNPHDVEDTLQESLLRLHRGAHTFKGRASVLTWMTTIAQNTAVTMRTRLSKVPVPTSPQAPLIHSGLVPAVMHSPPDHGDEWPAVLDIAEQLAGLDPDLRHVLLLAGVWGFTMAATSEYLGVPVGTVKSRTNRARATLRSRLALQPAPARPAAAR